MGNFSKIIFCLIFSASLAGCEEDPQIKLKRERGEQFPTLYLKKYRNEATIVVQYENCVKGKEESLEKCLFMTTKNDMQKYVVNKYIAQRMDYVRTGEWEKLPKEEIKLIPKKDTIDLQKYNINLPQKSS